MSEIILTDEQKALQEASNNLAQPFDHAIFTSHLEALREAGTIQGWQIVEMFMPQCNGIAKIYELVDGVAKANFYLFNYSRSQKSYTQILLTDYVQR